MISNETDLKDDVRQQTGYTSSAVLSTDGLDTAFRTAKRHLRVEKGLSTSHDWFDPDSPASCDALFWYTCLFSKVQTGELDSQNIQVGAVDMDALLAKDDDEVTSWYRNAAAAKRAINGTAIIRSTSPSRTDREYTPDSAERDSGTDTGGGSGDSGLGTDI